MLNGDSCFDKIPTNRFKTLNYLKSLIYALKIIQ